MTTAARTTLRQLCNLGLPGPLLLPTLLASLRQVVSAAHGGFFYCDEQGAITNLYAERMLAPKAMAGFYDRHSREQFKRQYLERVAAPEAVSRRSVGAAERASSYFKEVLGPLRVAHVLYGIVRHHGSVLGQLSLYREEGQAPFSAADEQALAGVLHYLGAALAVPSPQGLQEVLEHTVEEGLAVLDEQGQELFSDSNWPRLVRMAHGNAINPANAMADAQELPRFVAAVAAAVLSAPNALHQVNTAWGRFAFRRHAVHSSSGQQAEAVLVSRFAAEPLRLAEGAAKLGLSPQQREVALLMARGSANAEMAAQLGVSVNTVAYHAKQVFARLGVHERSEVAKALSQAAVPAGAAASARPGAR